MSEISNVFNCLKCNDTGVIEAHELTHYCKCKKGDQAKADRLIPNHEDNPLRCTKCEDIGHLEDGTWCTCSTAIARKTQLDKVFDSNLNVGPDLPTITNEEGGKQSEIHYRMDLLPFKALLEVSKVLKEGSDKYDTKGTPDHPDQNWRKIPRREHLNRVLVHVAAYLTGDRQDDHLSHAACRILFAMEVEEHKQEVPF